MAKPRIERDWADCYVIVTGNGKNKKRWAPKDLPPGWAGMGYASFATRASAERFIKSGGMIDVTVVPMGQAMAEAGWDEALGYGSEENNARIQRWCEENNAHWFAAEKEDCFEFAAIAEAQKLGCTKVVIENLS